MEGFSAIIGDGAEERYTLDADHRSMVKHSGIGDPNYDRVFEVIRDLFGKSGEIMRVSSVTEGRSRTFNGFIEQKILMWSIPAPVHHFTGRSEIIAQIQDSFALPTAASDNNPCKIQVLRGIGGMGKSQTALMFAQQSRNKYSAGIYIDASSNDTIQRSFTNIAASIAANSKELSTKSASSVPQPSGAVEFVKRWLKARPLEMADDF